MTEPSNDLFDRWPFARRLAVTIADRSEDTPLVVALYGEWGEGKTTVLNFMEAELIHHGQVVPVKFNPWRFPSEPDLITGFFTMLADRLGQSLPTKKEKLGALVTSYGALAAALVDRRDLAKSLGESLSSVSLESLRDRLEAMLTEERKKVVILTDDIDRLEKSEVHAIFRLVKLTAGLHNLTFVLAFDSEIVADALQERYGSSDPHAGRKR